MKAVDGAIIVNDDNIVKAIHEDRYKLYDENLKPLYKAVEHFIVEMALGMDRDVVINRPNTKRKTRERFIKIGREAGAKIILVRFPWKSPEVHAQRRLEHDGRGHDFAYWLNVAMKFHDSRESIVGENYDEMIDYEHKQLNEL